MSIDGLGSGVRTPFSSRSYCMKTRFQISMYRPEPVPSSQPISGRSGRRSTKISLHGPHGPVSPIAQKLSALPQRWTLPGDRLDSLPQRSNASSSSS